MGPFRTSRSFRGTCFDVASWLGIVFVFGRLQEKEIHAMSSSITARIDEMGARIESLDTHVDQLMDRSKAASEAAEPSGEGG